MARDIVQKSRMRKFDFRSLLILLFAASIIVLALSTSIAVSRITQNSVREQLIKQGVQVTSSFSEGSKLALLYRSEDYAEEAAQTTLGFPDIAGLAIYDIDGKQIIARGKQLPWESMLSTVPKDGARLFKNDESHWYFSAPVVFGLDTDYAEEFVAEDVPKPELLGFVFVSMSKQSLDKMEAGILRGSMFVSLGIALVLFPILLMLTNRMTNPLKKLASIMHRAEKGEENIRAELGGPKDITNMQHAFNTMMEVLDRRELELKLARDAAIDSARVKGEFAANVSHELRTPMNAVLGMLDLLATMGLSSKQLEYVEIAKSSGEGLLELIDEVLNFAKIDSGRLALEKTDCHLEEILDEIVGLIAGQALKKNLDIGHVIDSNVPEIVNIDSAKIRQVLINLAGNAVKFTERGQIALKVDILAIDNDQNMLRFEVSDTGIGIAPDAQSHVFDAFTQADSSTTRKYGGTGLGLTITRELVHLMGGDISLSSRLGTGSNFWFTIPLEKGESPAETADIKSLDKVSTLRALVVDDCSVVREFIGQQFKKWNLQSDFVDNGLEALERLRDLEPEDEGYDLILIDEDMPGLQGKDLLRLLNMTKRGKDSIENESGTRFILMRNPWGGSANTPVPVDAHILTKPLNSQKLYQLLSGVAKPDSRQSVAVDVSSEESPGLPKKILVVDDNRANQMVAAGMLEKLGFKYEISANGDEAIDLLLRKQFDLVLMDCQMPVMDGYEATTRIRKLEGEGPNLPIIAMTANNQPEEVDKCLSSGMSDFLGKPLRLELLQEILVKWTGSGAVTHDAPELTTEALRGEICDSTVIEELKNNVGEVFTPMLEAYLDDTPVYLRSLKQAVAEGDVKQMRELAHTIKGSSANFGALSVVALSRQMEEMGNSADTKGAKDLVQMLCNEFDKLRKVLEKYLGGRILSSGQETGGEHQVLIVDDDRSVRMALKNFFQNDGYEIEEANNGAHALSICQRRMPDLILMDGLMPEMDGFKACEKIRQLPHGGEIPILIITALEDEESIVKAFSSGASDYIPKPIHFSVMRQRVARLIQASKIEKHVKQLAYHDQLTGLPNRAHLMQKLRVMINRASLNNQNLAVLFLDLDRFKMINDSLGHDAGDLLLKAVSDRITRCVREHDFVARLGGDEFTVVLQGVHSREVVASIARKICESVSLPFAFLQQKMFISTSIGISMYPDDGEDIGSLLKHADSAMFSAKEKKEGYSFYVEGMEDEIASRLELEHELRHALKADELVLYYQPQFDVETKSFNSAEALVRWEHPIRGLLMPDRFIPLAEETGLISGVGDCVLRQACRQIKLWADQGKNVRVAVNLSGKELQTADLRFRLKSMISELGLLPDLLELEITETVLLENPEQTIDELQALKEMGITLAIDDFGSGFSSLNYLRRLPVDVLKIDQTFIRDMHNNDNDHAIVKGIVALAHSLGLKTVAEGVEAEQQKDLLIQMGCDCLQGYLFERPIPVEDFSSKYLADKVPEPPLHRQPVIILGPEK